MRLTCRSRVIFELIFMVSLLGVSLPSGFGQTRVDPRLVGEWTATMPGSPIPVVFRVETSGRCSLDEEVGTFTLV